MNRLIVHTPVWVRQFVIDNENCGYDENRRRYWLKWKYLNNNFKYEQGTYYFDCVTNNVVFYYEGLAVGVLMDDWIWKEMIETEVDEDDDEE